MERAHSRRSPLKLSSPKSNLKWEYNIEWKQLTASVTTISTSVWTKTSTQGNNLWKLSPPPYKNKPAAKNNDHDFFGLEEDEEERDRLPVINQPSKSKLQPDSKSIGKANTKL